MLLLLFGGLRGQERALFGKVFGVDGEPKFAGENIVVREKLAISLLKTHVYVVFRFVVRGPTRGDG